MDPLTTVRLKPDTTYDFGPLKGDVVDAAPR
jgi:hypothetical protein